MNKKILVFTNKRLEDKKFLGFDVETSTTIPRNKEELEQYLNSSSTDYEIIIVDTEWYNTVRSTEDPALFPNHQKMSKLNLNIGHEETDRFYVADVIDYSDADKIRKMHFSAKRKSEKEEKLELRFCVAVDYRYLLPYLDLADLLYSPPNGKMDFLINFNYTGSIEENDLECDSVLVRAGDLVSTYNALVKSYPLESFDTVELYRIVKQDQYISEPDFDASQKSGKTNDTKGIVRELLKSAIFGK